MLRLFALKGKIPLQKNYTTLNLNTYISDLIQVSAVEIRQKMTIGCNFAYSSTNYMEKSLFYQHSDGEVVKITDLRKNFKSKKIGGEGGKF